MDKVTFEKFEINLLNLIIIVEEKNGLAGKQYSIVRK